MISFIMSQSRNTRYAERALDKSSNTLAETHRINSYDLLGDFKHTYFESLGVRSFFEILGLDLNFLGP